ncbi:hypothetical protein HBI24_090790 [Parastagonospora nodorum]|nr:hypothetical protein HBI24_090790 [Parastagonospora nodorum]KAH6496338.1 hypothetical protein HBI55_097220 [Parastagonospora nodorum]
MFWFSSFAFAALIVLLSPLVESTSSNTSINTTNPITLVTAWYPHPGYNPKYPNKEEAYRRLIGEVLSRVQTPIVIYTPSSESEFILSSRPAGAPIIINNTYETIWDVPNLSTLAASFHTDQRKIAWQDEERTNAREDSPHMYGVWNAKVSFLNMTAMLNPFDSEYLFWHDAAASLSYNGSLESWPDPNKISKIFSRHEGYSDKLLMVARELQPAFPVDASWEVAPLTRTIAGVFFGGTPRSIQWLAKEYYDMLYYYLSLNQFVGVEELLLLSIALQYPRRIVCVPCYRCSNPDARSLDHIYYYLDFLAAKKDNTLAPLFGDIPKGNPFY